MLCDISQKPTSKTLILSQHFEMGQWYILWANARPKNTQNFGSTLMMKANMSAEYQPANDSLIFSH